MGDSIKERISNLARFQQLELDIARLRGRLDTVGPRLEALASGIRAYEQAIGEGKARIDDLKKRYRESERQVQANQDKIAKSQDKLRQVKTNKEYRSTLKEIEDMERANSAIEDAMLGLLEETEGAEAELLRQQTAYERESVSIAAEQKEVNAEAQTMRARMALLEKDLSAASAQVDPRLMKTFLQVRAKQGDSIGLAGVRKAVCQGCYVNIRPQLFNDMQRWDAIYNCPNCQRIIYWDDSEETAEVEEGNM